MIAYKETFKIGSCSIFPFSSNFFPWPAHLVTSSACLSLCYLSDDSLGYGCLLAILHSDTGELILVCTDIAD